MSDRENTDGSTMRAMAVLNKVEYGKVGMTSRHKDKQRPIVATDKTTLKV